MGSSTNRRLRRGKRHDADGSKLAPALTSSEGLSEEDATTILEHALARSRKEGLRLFELQRALVVGSAAAALVVGGRGIAAVAFGSGPALELALALAVALIASAAMFVYGLRVRTKMERLTRDVEALEAARARGALDPSSPVEIHPYRVREGVVRPVVVVRTDDVEHVFRKGSAAAGAEPPSWSGRATATFLLLVAGVVAVSVIAQGRAATRHRWTFIDDSGSHGERGFRAGPASAGPWSLEDDHAATGARALVNHSGDGDAPAATFVANAIKARDVRGSTRCRVSAEGHGGACGLVFRYVDDATYHVARVDVGAGRVVLSRVRGGTEHELGRAEVRISAGVWYELGVEARGDAIRVACNGRSVIETADASPSSAGTVGLWAPAGTQAFFDELSVEVLSAAPHAFELGPMFSGRS